MNEKLQALLAQIAILKAAIIEEAENVIAEHQKVIDQLKALDLPPGNQNPPPPVTNP